MGNGKSCGYVYILLNDCGEVVYIGSTGNIESRMYQHFRAPRGRFRFEEPKEVRYCKLPSRNDALIVETILIQKYKPCYNKMTVDDGGVSLSSFDEDSVEWFIRTPSDFFHKKDDIAKKRDISVVTRKGPVFCALRELFPDADLRKGSVTKHQRWVLFANFMQDGQYWLPRMTDLEVELVNEQLFMELARNGVEVNCG